MPVLDKSEQCLQRTKSVIGQWLYFDFPSTCLCLSVKSITTCLSLGSQDSEVRTVSSV